MHARFLSQLNFMDFPQPYNYVHTNVVAVNTNFPRWIDFGAAHGGACTYLVPILLTLWKNEQTLDSINRVTLTG